MRRTSWGWRTGGAGKPDAPLILAVVRLPFISNFTDFDALADEEDVAVRYVLRAAELAGADAVILPGTKSTIADLHWLRTSGHGGGYAGAVAAGDAAGGHLRRVSDAGSRILDPAAVESAPGRRSVWACSTSTLPSPPRSAPCAPRRS